MLYNAAERQDYHDLFNSADNDISIFTGKYDTEYADDFIIAASNFSRQPGSTLRIACQCGEYMAQCHILKSILAAPERQGEILIYDAREFRDEPYFILADESAYRIEIPALAETILDYDNQDEIDRLYAQFHQILSLSSLKKYPTQPSQANE